MWASAGNHGNRWTYANVILSNTTPFKVTFQAEVGGDVWTDIALDDISYTAECMVGGKRLFICLVFYCTSLILYLQHYPRLSFHCPQSSPAFFFFSLSSTFDVLQHPLPHLSFLINKLDPRGEGRKLMEPVALWIRLNSL